MSCSLKLMVSTCRFGISVKRSFRRWVAPTYKCLKNRKDAMEQQPITKRSDFLEWNYNAELFSFGKRLGENFKEDALRQALIEKSYIDLEIKRLEKVGVEPQLEVRDNSDLALEGEKFMSQFVVEYLKTVLPSLPSEHIREIHDELMSDQELAHVSKNIGIDDIVLTADFPPTEQTLSNALKSVTQALLLSSGGQRAAEFVKDFVLTQLCGRDLTPLCTPQNPIEKLKSIAGQDVESRIIAETARNSLLANYQVGIYKDKELIGRGCGESAWIAEEMAALDALWRLWGIPHNKKPFPIRAGQMTLKNL